MRVLITVVGKRTEHWTAFFAALGRRPDVELTVLATDVSEVTLRDLDRLSDGHPRVRHLVVPHLLGGDGTGHPASVLFRPGYVRQLADYRPDVVHVIGEAAYLTTWQSVRLRRRLWSGVPMTLYAAQDIVMRFPFPYPLLERRAYRAVDHAFPVTPAALDVLRARNYHQPATVVALGVDPAVFRPRPQLHTRPRRFTAGFVGRLEPHQGIRDLLRATALLDCDLTLVGDGSLRDEIEAVMGRRPGRITLHDQVHHDQLPELLAGMDALVVPPVEVVARNLVPWIGSPLREQFGRVLVEAMACGVPVVGSDMGEIPYVVGSAGLIFPAGDPAALADRLGQLRDQPGLAHRLAGSAARRVAERFTWDSVADRMCEVWTELIGMRGSAAFPALPARPTDR